MRFPRSALLATAYLTLQTHALPRPATPSYSVVAVDGGAQNANPAPPTTIIQTVTDAAESTPTTVSITIQETEPPATTTVLSTQQAPPASAPPPQTITINGEVSVISAPTYVVPGSRTSYTTTATAVVSETTTVLGDAEASTVYQDGPTTTVLSVVTPSTSYFDDGMWHTSYGVPVWPTQGGPQRQYNGTTSREAGPTGHLGR